MTAINKDGLLIVFALDKPLGSSLFPDHVLLVLMALLQIRST
jgi:hypothetical protein